MRSLAQHPGWVLVMAHLNNRKAMMENILAGRTSAVDLVMDPRMGGLDGLIRYHTEIVRLETAVYWLGHIQEFVRRAEAHPELQSAQPDI